MRGLIDWIKEEENLFFAVHAIALFLLAFAAELLAPAWTKVAYPSLLLLGAASFTWNYPVKAIKSHGLFSEYLIESRLLWLVLFGALSEYLAYEVVENGAQMLYVGAALAIGLLAAFYSRSRLHEKIVKARGFK